MNSQAAFVSLALSCLAGCSSVPTVLRGNFADVTQTQASLAAFLGTEVRWGGVVVGARESSRGECLEIADFPLDAYYARPYTPDTFSHAALFRKDVVNYYLTESPRDSMPARFLACDAPRVDSKLERVGTVLTVTGMIEPAAVVQVIDDACTPPVARTMWQRNERVPNYVGTEHVSDDGRCVVSLPTVQARAIYAWKEPPGAPLFH